MRLLQLHSDFIEVDAKKEAIKNCEAIKDKILKKQDCLVVFIAGERNDELNREKILQDAEKSILNHLQQINVKNIVLYPYVHLTSTPSSPSFAQGFLEELEAKLKDNKLDVVHAPFGWYKEFNIKVKGHPLAELSRELKVEEGKTEILQKKEEKEEQYDPAKLLNQISKSKLDRTELKENDHRIIGQKMDLFSFNEVAPGMVFWHNNGWTIYNELINFWREEHRKADYQEIATPQILDKRLWQISGHWEKYKENIFLTKYEGRDFAVKPMNCPGGMLVFKSKPKSYKDLPLRAAELGTVHRQELSGVLSGLFRVIKFTQDDAHIFCTEQQLETEITSIIDMIDKFYNKFNVKLDHVELSTRPEKRIGSDEVWDKAETVLENVLKHKKMTYKVNAGDGAFYGPKIDFHAKDSLNRTWQLSTIQLDFAMPERFDLVYIGEDNKEHRPVMLHRVIYGAIERFIGVLLEHTDGRLPTWLAPVQVRIINLMPKNVPYAERILKEMQSQGIRADSDFRDNTMESKIRDAEVERVKYIIVIGDKEEQNNTVAIRTHGQKPKFGTKKEEFLEQINKEIKERI